MGFFNHQTGKYQRYSDAERKAFGERQKAAFVKNWKKDWCTTDELKTQRFWTDAAIAKYLGEKEKSNTGYLAYSRAKVEKVERSNREFRAWWLKRVIKRAKEVPAGFNNNFIKAFNQWEKVHQEVDVMHILEFKHPRKYKKKAPEPKRKASTKPVYEGLTSTDVVCLLEDRQQWIDDLALQHCPFIKKMKTPPQASFFQEVTVRVDTDDVDRFGKPKPQRRRIDMVSLIRPHFKAWGSDKFSVGIEIKVSEYDLVGDEKWQDYLPYCDYFCFAVPAGLLEVAKEKVADYPAVGIISADTGEWYKMPTLNEVYPYHSSELYKQIAFSL